MALLASKNPIPAAFGPATHSANTPQTTYPPSRRPPAVPMTNQSFASPTEADFSDHDGPDSVRNWDEEQVCAYLRSVKCGDYERLFRRNHINGENLLEMDKEVLKEIGVDKVGDRVRLFVCIKKLRTKAYGSQKKRNRDSFVSLDTQFAPSSNSPRPLHSANSNWATIPNASSKRYSRQYDSSAHMDTSKNSRPPSPLSSGGRPRHAQPQGYSSQPPVSTSSRFPMSPPDSSHSARTQHTRNNSSVDGSLMAALPQGQGVIRVISTGGVTKVVKVADCKNCAEVMRLTLRKFALREDHERNYCFWILNGTEPDPKHCQPVGDKELWNIINDQNRPERNRLMLRRVPAGCPGQAELERAAEIALEEQQSKNQSHGMVPLENRSQLKVQKILGEKWDTMQQPPLSPVSYEDRERNVYNAARDLERPAPSPSPRAIPRRKQQLRQFGGLRPPSELIASDLTSYFPDHSREKIDQTARLSMRRSARLSKFNHRLSVASTLSFASSIQDAPPIPQIAGNWLTASNQVAKIRPRDPAGRSPLGYRDSVTSSVLDPLQEESSPIEPNRKSYVSFADSGSDTAAVSVTDPDGNVVRQSYYDGDSTLGSGGSGSYEEVSQALNEEGEDADEELRSFLAGESWDDNKWMKGALIGQGSFGSVYLALHAITGELLAVKQVEAPSPGSNGSTDSRKKSMIDALKREISLLRELRHPNIVQYLGCGTSAEYLNIFLEYVPGGSVQTMLNSYGSLPEPLVRSFVRQILNGLSYLHSRDIIHRDIKGANILVDNKGTVKISDFGISKKLEASNILQGANNNKNRPSMQGSVFWMAPEVVKQTSYTRKADIWSLGCLVVEMMTGTHPFPDCSQLQAIFKIGGAKASPTIPEHASQEAKQFLAQTFEMDYNKRPSADELMLSPFLTPPA